MVAHEHEEELAVILSEAKNPSSFSSVRMGIDLLCERCVAVHKEREEHDEGYLLPIVNSPRAGVCAYTGPA